MCVVWIFLCWCVGVLVCCVSGVSCATSCIPPLCPMPSCRLVCAAQILALAADVSALQEELTKVVAAAKAQWAAAVDRRRAAEARAEAQAAAEEAARLEAAREQALAEERARVAAAEAARAAEEARREENRRIAEELRVKREAEVRFVVVVLFFFFLVVAVSTMDPPPPPPRSRLCPVALACDAAGAATHLLWWLWSVCGVG